MVETRQEIVAWYLKIHNDLSEAYYNQHLMTKEQFEHAHGDNWADMDSELIAKGFKEPPKESFSDEVRRRLSALEEGVISPLES